LYEFFRLWLNWAFDFCRAGIRRAFGTPREIFKNRIENQSPLVPHPRLIIRGGKDPTVPQRAAEEMVRFLPNGKLLVIDGEPHCVHYTQPELVCRIIEEHTLGRE
jgi:pimeloyl-ACP methyl ester carboxylesterase